MNDEILEEVLSEYAQTRMRNERTELERKSEIHDRFPEITRLTDERVNLINDSLRAVLEGRSVLDDLPERIAKLTEQIRKTLKANGLPEDYLAPVYRCAKCKDTGYFGEPVKEMCDCLKAACHEKIKERLGLKTAEPETFERFDIDLFDRDNIEGKGYSQREIMKNARERCETWCGSYPEQKPRDILFMGASGLGKSYLMHAMANRLTERGVQVLLTGAGRFFQAAYKSVFQNDGTELREMADVPVLMIDDLGSEPMMNNITVESLFELLDGRQCAGLATLISTNLDKEDFRRRYTERIASRVMDDRNCSIIQLLGTDLRRKGARKP